ncbi:MAG: glucan 1,4-alpha-glucosidase [Chloroflexi bacterium]|nr:glucan 1,4-alpha-glucosidase [Chloroflexota bacterium]
MSDTQNAPGIAPRWTSSAKSGVGTSLSDASRVWFTLSHGILDEVYFPRVDTACTRDLGLLVSDGRDFFSEEKRDAMSEVSTLADGVPAYRLVNSCKQGRYRIEKQIVADPLRDAVLQWTRFTPLAGALDDYHLYALLAPHLGNFGAGNTAWVGDYKGTPMLFATRDDDYALALACSAPWLKRSAGFAGVSDGWQDVHAHKQMQWAYPRAENGNVALTGEIDLRACGGEFVLALAFGQSAAEAGHRALASLVDGFSAARDAYVAEWQQWQSAIVPPTPALPGERDLYRTSAAVLRTHEAANFPGGMIASLSIPWGFAQGDDDLGGYHLVWPRDLVETAGGLLAAGARDDARRVAQFLHITQEADGHWSQNMWLDGTPYWGGVQMDETALPILLLDLLRRESTLEDGELAEYWPMVRRAASYLVANGPVTQEDRWEEDPGYSPFTLAAEIAGLLAAADFADANGEGRAAQFLRETADVWNASIERWIYASDTDLARAAGVDGYYVRIAPPDVADAASPSMGFVPIKNRPPGESDEAAASLVSPDALALVRFGLRAPGDPRIVNTVRVLDYLLKVETPNGPSWHRYNDDGYGEHADGSPFDGTGVGRAWPLLTAERAHYELSAGRRDSALALLHAVEAFAGDGGMIPEQIWDSPDIPEKELTFGHPSGSAMPLVWAHAEYIKLRRSLRDGRIFDTPPAAAQRYARDHTGSPHALWSFNLKARRMAQGKTLRIVATEPARVRWSTDNWQTTHDADTQDSTLGAHYLDLPTEQLPAGATVTFTFYWPGANDWEGENYSVSVE